MKVLHLNAADRIGGAAIAAHRLHVGLREHAVASSLLVGIKSQNDDTVTVTNARFGYYLNRFLHRYCFSSGYDGLLAVGGARQTARFIGASDVVHLHNMHGGFFSLPYVLRKAGGTPIVWTLHDMWALTGGCCFAYECTAYFDGCAIPAGGTCNQQRRQSVWNRKRQLYRSRQLHLVVPSLAMLDLVRQSPLTRHLPVDCIPFGVDLRTFQPGDKADTKRSLGISDDSVVIGFRASLDRQKGLRYVVESLASLRAERKICLLALNQQGLVDELKDRFQVVELGWITDQKQMAVAYNAMDLFLMPSTAESFGLMAMECMACAVPVIAFDKTVLVDTLFAPRGGVAVPQGNVAALREALIKFVSDDCSREEIGRNALKLAREHYDMKSHVSRMIELYRRVIGSVLSR